MTGNLVEAQTRLTVLSRIRTWVTAYRTPLAALVFWFILLGLTRLYMNANNLTFSELTSQLQNTLTAAWYGPILYLFVYLVRPVILFPASLLTILGGSVFGLWPGFLYVLIAGTLSAIIPYVIGRWFASDQQAAQTSTSAIQRFTRLMRQNPFQAVLTMRLIYLPYDAVSIIAGNLRLPFTGFLLATALGNIAGTLSFVGLGASIEGDLASGEIALNPVVLAFSVVVLVASLGFSRILGRLHSAQSEETA